MNMNNQLAGLAVVFYIFAMVGIVAFGMSVLDIGNLPIDSIEAKCQNLPTYFVSDEFADKFPSQIKPLEINNLPKTAICVVWVEPLNEQQRFAHSVLALRNTTYYRIDEYPVIDVVVYK
jgi:hypothetical protein